MMLVLFYQAGSGDEVATKIFLEKPIYLAKSKPFAW